MKIYGRIVGVIGSGKGSKDHVSWEGRGREGEGKKVEDELAISVRFKTAHRLRAACHSFPGTPPIRISNQVVAGVKNVSRPS